MNQQAHVAHYIPGRIRIKLQRAQGDSVLLQQIKEGLSTLPGVTKVDVRPLTGSVIIHYNSNVGDFPAHLAERAKSAELFNLLPPEMSEVEEIVQKLETEAEFLAEHSRTARSILNSVEYLNERIRQATANTVDLKVLLPLAVAVYAFFWVDRKQGAPLWITLLIFSFNSFLDLHQPEVSLTPSERRPSSAGRRNRRAGRRAASPRLKTVESAPGLG